MWKSTFIFWSHCVTFFVGADSSSFDSFGDLTNVLKMAPKKALPKSLAAAEEQGLQPLTSYFGAAVVRGRPKLKKSNAGRPSAVEKALPPAPAAAKQAAATADPSSGNVAAKDECTAQIAITMHQLPVPSSEVPTAGGSGIGVGRQPETTRNPCTLKIVREKTRVRKA